jgi:chromosome segregation ATPase
MAEDVTLAVLAERLRAVRREKHKIYEEWDATRRRKNELDEEHRRLEQEEKDCIEALLEAIGS